MSLEDWYLFLPPGYNDRAKFNMDKQMERDAYRHNLKANCLAAAVMMGFAWSETPEGNFFWADLHTAVRDYPGDESKLPPLPEPND